MSAEDDDSMGGQVGSEMSLDSEERGSSETGPQRWSLPTASPFLWGPAFQIALRDGLVGEHQRTLFRDAYIQSRGDINRVMEVCLGDVRP